MNLVYVLGSAFLAWSLLRLLGGERHRRLEKLRADLTPPPEPQPDAEEPITVPVVGSALPRA